MPYRGRLRYATVWAAPWLALLAGCMVGPDFHSPSQPQSSRYSATPVPQKTTTSQQLVSRKPVPREWWKAFHNHTLNGLIVTGLAQSPTLDSAKAALIQAEETLNAGIGSALWPSVSANLAASRTKFSQSSFGNSNPNTIFNLFNAAVNVSYALDIFGGARREVENLRATVEYQQYQKEIAQLTLAGNIATTAMTIASLREQIAATEALIAAQESQLKIVLEQYILGGTSESDVLLQKSQVAAAQATLPGLQLSLDQNIHALAILTGQPPADMRDPGFSLHDLQLPPILPLSLPSTVLKARPDVRAAEAALHAANAKIGVATANLFPQFTISANGGYEANVASRLLHSVSNTWDLGTSLTQPVFNAGSLFATRRAAIAARDQTAAQYRQTVLQALKNVADSLRAIQQDARTQAAFAQEKKAAHHSLVLSHKQYELGGTNYLNVLAAEVAYEQALLSEIVARAARYTDTVALYVALGGGFQEKG